jgi:hypothetical protein
VYLLFVYCHHVLDYTCELWAHACFHGAIRAVPLLEHIMNVLHCLGPQVAVALAEAKVLAAEVAAKLQKGEHAKQVTTRLGHVQAVCMPDKV